MEVIVDLPEPDWPTMAIDSFGNIFSEKLSSII